MHVLVKFGFLISVGLFLSSCAIYHSTPKLPPRSEVTAGSTVTVQGNQSVYAVAREHNVSMRDLIVLNNLQPPFSLRPGQTLTLPVGASGGYGDSHAGYAANYQPSYKSGNAPVPSSSPSPEIEQVQLPPIEVKPIPAPASALAPPTTTHMLPASSPRVEYKQTPQSLPAAAAPAVSPKSAPVESLNKPADEPKAVATTITPAQIDPPTASKTSSVKAPVPSETMVWPVKGPILSAFGPKGQGLNNDGTNIGAPKGAPVVAASNGIVVYAGSEMKGFGNLVLIRHKDGWVTAYAHLDRVLVTKDVVVAQGDMIGTVGKTGNVPSPQLHFETRYEGKPVDPATVIKTQ